MTWLQSCGTTRFFIEQVRIHHFWNVLSFPSALGERMRFVAVLSQTEYSTRAQKCWEFPEKSHSTELNSSKRLKKPSSFTTAAAERRFRSTLSIYYPFSGGFTWSTTTHSQFAPCQQQPAPTAQKPGIGWIKLYQSNTDSSEIQHSLK